MSVAAILEAAWREIARRPLRATLAIVGITLATTILVALVALGRGIQLNVVEQSSTPFLTMVQVLPGAPTASGSARPLDDGALQAIRSVPHVREALPAIVVPASLSAAGHQAGGTVIGLASAARAPYSLATGHVPTATETDAAVLTPIGLRALGLTAETAIGASAQLELRRGDARTERRTLPVRVVGVSVEDIPGEIALIPLPLAEDAISWIATGETDSARDLRLAQQAASALLFGSGVAAADLSASRYTTIWVFADAVSEVRGVARAISDLGFGTFSNTALAQTIDDAFRAVNAGLLAIAVVTLLIAALGIANAMVTTVSERTLEIGVLKAIGAADEDVHRLVLAQAALLGAIGGISGVVLGVAAAVLSALVIRDVAVRSFMPVVDGPLVGAALGVAIAVSLIASWAPAARAAALPPGEALRAE